MSGNRVCPGPWPRARRITSIIGFHRQASDRGTALGAYGGPYCRDENLSQLGDRAPVALGAAAASCWNRSCQTFKAVASLWVGRRGSGSSARRQGEPRNPPLRPPGGTMLSTTATTALDINHGPLDLTRAFLVPC